MADCSGVRPTVVVAAAATDFVSLMSFDDEESAALAVRATIPANRRVLSCILTGSFRKLTQSVDRRKWIKEREREINEPKTLLAGDVIFLGRRDYICSLGSRSLYNEEPNG